MNLIIEIRLDYRFRLWAPTSASRAISAVAELLVIDSIEQQLHRVRFVGFHNQLAHNFQQPIILVFTSSNYIYLESHGRYRRYNNVTSSKGLRHGRCNRGMWGTVTPHFCSRPVKRYNDDRGSVQELE